MKSPFPGLDPYLEPHWRDIHVSLLVYVADQLNAQLPDDMHIRVEEDVANDEDFLGDNVDFDASFDDDLEFDPSTITSSIAVAEPEVLVIGPCPPQRHLAITDVTAGRVVTAIEILSPGNKTGAGWTAYRKKQREYLKSGANLVEIDLIRSGKCRTPCCACVTRPGVAEFYPVSLREPLPNIRVPLRPRDADIVLQLQPLLDNCYLQGRYAGTDYARPPCPSLDPDDEVWADALLREQGRR